MRLYERSISIPKLSEASGLLQDMRNAVMTNMPDNEAPVRLVVTRSDQQNWSCELGLLDGEQHDTIPTDFIFDFKQRDFESSESFNAVLIVPTGIDAQLGGHAGDAGAVARLMAGSCDNLITHPNVVNASDLNELADNGLYVEGSILTRLLMGTVGLQKVRSNRVLVVLDKHEDEFFYEAAINSVSGARASLGLDCVAVVLMEDTISMRSLYSNSGRAVGSITRLERLCKVLEQYHGQYDAVALSSIILVPRECHMDYFKTDMINPWGGVESMLTHAVSSLYDIPSAHSPMLEDRAILNLSVGAVDPRKAAEAVSTTFLHCILRGLHKSPRIVKNPRLDGQSGVLTVSDVSCMVIPDGCVGLPTLAAIEQGIPVIAVRENRNRMHNNLEDLPFASGQLHIVENYLEAVGVMNAVRAGVSPETVRRPMRDTRVEVSGNPVSAGTDEIDAVSNTESEEHQRDEMGKRTA